MSQKGYKTHPPAVFNGQPIRRKFGLIYLKSSSVFMGLLEKPETFSLLLGVYCLNFVELCCSFPPGSTRPGRRFNLMFKTFTLKCFSVF